MSIDRRVNAQARRRRVLYQTSSDITTESAAERRAAEKLREARRPTASYGSHVNRRLRGRWFSLVPVRRLTTAICGVVILGSAFLLTTLHLAAVTWAPLAYQPELARPLRLDRPDSIGTWAKTFFLAAAAATALLVYQLRRYKVDDYTGRYRIWRPVIVLVAILSIDSVCDLVPWFGAMIDATLGKRIALAGADWIRIVLTVGGGVMALQLIAEIRKSKLALSMMLLAVAGFAVPLLGRTHLIDATQLPGWIAVTSAPLVASAALWFSIGGYLRMLLREVRGLDDARLAQRQDIASQRQPSKKKTDADADTVRGWGWGWFRRDPADKLAATEGEKQARPRPARSAAPPAAKLENKTKEPSKTGWFGRAKKVAEKPAEEADPPAKPTPAAREPEPRESTAKSSVETKRRWFALRQRAKTGGDEAAEPAKPRVLLPKPEVTDKEAKVKRSWLSRLRAKPAAGDASKPLIKAPHAKTESKKPESASEEARPVRKGLGGWLRRDPSPAAAAPAAATQPPAKTLASRSNSDDAEDDDEEIGDDSIDWESMNKSERRRMRKEIKRGGRAA